MSRITTALLLLLAACVVNVPANAVGDCNQNATIQSDTQPTATGCLPPSTPASITAPSTSSTGEYTVSWGLLVAETNY